VISATSSGVRFGVEVKVRASQSRVLGIKGESLSVALAAPPVDGAANRSLIELLSEYFAVPRRRVRIVTGEKSKRKVVELEGVSLAEVRTRLEAAGHRGSVT
jgi:uncharacterized protein (TIGR00251 family)